MDTSSNGEVQEVHGKGIQNQNTDDRIMTRLKTDMMLVTPGGDVTDLEREPARSHTRIRRAIPP